MSTRHARRGILSGGIRSITTVKRGRGWLRRILRVLLLLWLLIRRRRTQRF